MEFVSLLSDTSFFSSNADVSDFQRDFIEMQRLNREAEELRDSKKKVTDLVTGLALAVFFRPHFERIFNQFLDTEFAPFVEDRWRQLFDLEERDWQYLFEVEERVTFADIYANDSYYGYNDEDFVVEIDSSVLEPYTPVDEVELESEPTGGVTEDFVNEGSLTERPESFESPSTSDEVVEEVKPPMSMVVVSQTATNWADDEVSEDFDMHKYDDVRPCIGNKMLKLVERPNTMVPEVLPFETNQLLLVKEIRVDPFAGLLEHHEHVLARNDWTSLAMYLPMMEVPHCGELVTLPVRHMPMELIQSAVDELLPGVADLDDSFFQELVETSGVALELDRVSIDTSVFRDWTKPSKNLQSKLNTGAISKRVPTFREAALAVKKRNLNVPNLQQVLLEDEEARKIANRFINTVLDPNKLAQFPGYISEGEKGYFEQYLIGKKIPENAFVDPCALVSMDKYRHMIKTQLKPVEDTSCLFERPLAATITYHDKGKVMSTSPIFLMMANRLLLCLNDKITIPSGKYHQLFSIDPFAFEMTKEFKEIDFSKFDKSQQRLHHLIQFHIFTALGAPREFLQMWFGSHEVSHIRDGICGLGFSVDYQRRTGDACTYLGNTIITLSALAYLYDLLDPNITFVVASGDDSLIGSLKPLDRTNEFQFTTLFNFEAKFPHNMPFVCSKFLCLVPTLDGGKKVVAVPNALKLFIKLGVKDMKPEIFDAWYESWLDLLWYFDNYFIVSTMRDYISHRYLRKHTYFVEGGMLAFRTIFSSKTRCLQSLFGISPKDLPTADVQKAVTKPKPKVERPKGKGRVTKNVR
ncbi:RNA-dependent RNA polymerase [Lilac leaf chlorosis virus]|uniref:RNA-directed RNA polymerase 2a n=1 Tax=Lilac leaf chlorosis virus TaxID=722755 RepID=D6CHU1_9BROM|nr:RNA-dependent RNA polymerase [Lilac leaf chlorosis virus]CBJ94500.1 RNA-dependent RNA polymerase [Lilac leaf chlorosis virus]